MVKVKICGITNSEDAVAACESGSDLIGFIFIEDTPRAVSPDEVSKIISDMPEELRGTVAITGLFSNKAPQGVAEIAGHCNLNYVQLHGAEDPGYCGILKKIMLEKYGRSIKIIKAFKVKEEILPIGDFFLDDYTEVDFFVFDTFHPKISGGTGAKFNWEILRRENINKPFFIAGGLTPESVSEAVRVVRPYGVDTSSGVESSPGIKSEDMIKEFVDNAKNA